MNEVVAIQHEIHTDRLIFIDSEGNKMCINREQEWLFSQKIADEHKRRWNELKHFTMQVTLEAHKIHNATRDSYYRGYTEALESVYDKIKNLETAKDNKWTSNN